VQKFSVGIGAVWDYCVTANGDSVTFTDLVVTTAPFLLQEPFLSDRPKSTRSFLEHDTLAVHDRRFRERTASFLKI